MDIDVFAENNHFQFGTKNPTLMEKPFWKYMVCNPQLTSFDVANDCKNRNRDLPIWCFARFGATQTYLPDGRLIRIGGEHEDSYDPDFQIYNDVVVIKNPRFMKTFGYGMSVPSNFPQAYLQRHPINEKVLGTSNVNDVTIYGYPLDVFPPTDFHTATYVRCEDKKEYIYIIGGTGCKCAGNHQPKSCEISPPHDENTRVYRLFLSDFSIQGVETSGNIPRGCTFDHSARLLKLEGRKIIEIELSLSAVTICLKERNSIDPNPTRTVWKDHHKRYRLDVETGVWRI